MKGIKTLLVLLALSSYIPSAFACACDGNSDQQAEEEQTVMQNNADTNG